jgi:hypothetical protein
MRTLTKLLNPTSRRPHDHYDLETSPANGLEALRYHDNPASRFNMSIPPCGSWESKDALLAAAQGAVGANSGIKKKTGRFEGFLVCTAGGKKRERSTLTNEDDRQ